MHSTQSWEIVRENKKNFLHSKDIDLKNIGVRPNDDISTDLDAEIPDQDVMGLEGAPEEINTAIPDAGSTTPLPGTGLGPDGQGAI